MAQAVLKALAKQRTERYTDISAFITALITIPLELSQEAKKEWMTKLLAMALIPDQKEELIAACKQAIRLDPNEAMFHINKANVLQQQGKLAEARQAYENAQRLRWDLN